MFIRVAKQKRGARTYRHLQIAESFRDPAKGNAPRTRIIAQLGTVEGLGEEQIEKLIAGLKGNHRVRLVLFDSWCILTSSWLENRESTTPVPVIM